MRIVCGSLFSVDCSGAVVYIVSRALMVSICFSILGTVLLYERLYFCRSLALVPPRLPFFGGI